MKITHAVLSLILLAIAACAPQPRHVTLDEFGLSSLNGTPSDPVSPSCQEKLLADYQQGIYTFLKTTGCSSCHGDIPKTPAPSLANSDLNTSFLKFQSFGMDTLAIWAVSNHGFPISGPQNQITVNSLRSAWSVSQAEFASCLAKPPTSPEGPSSGTTLPPQEPLNLVMAEKNMADISATTNQQTFTWSLDVASDLRRDFQIRKIPMKFSITVKRVLNGTNTVAYEFSSPTAQLTDATNPYSLSGVIIQINGVSLQANDLDVVSPYLYISKRLTTTNTVLLRTDLPNNPTATLRVSMPNAVLGSGSANTDKFAIEIIKLEKIDGSLMSKISVGGI